MNNYNIFISTDEQTVVSEYTPEKQNRTQYQSEAELEESMIKQLVSQGYEHPDIHSFDEAVDNLRKCLEELNHYHFTDKEWQMMCDDYLFKSGNGIPEKTEIIQRDYIHDILCEDGIHRNIKIIDKNNIHNNRVQVINQYCATGNYDNRFDVSILVNGLPLVHCELKRRGVAIREAFNQIDRYQRDSFWAEHGLFEYVQIFVISNGTHTKYYSNTTRFSAIEEKNGKRRGKKEGSSSFEFTSYWADASNKNIKDLVDFTKTFFTKATLLNILTKYCVFTADRKLLVMRPYQIVATERILQKINLAYHQNWFGTVKAGGFVWHTTGSGKTLTSFKTSQLAANLDYIDKVLFVVDRNDLDYQTIKEYENYEKGTANGNKDTRTLTRQLENKDEKGNYKEYKIIVTTIQKLGVFTKKNATHPIYDKNVVLIFDECHRSQFGELHERIEKKFKKHAIFGFTGTPIFATNAGTAGNPSARTTEQLFGEKLHTYTIVDAINDKNVLPFRIDYINTVKSTDSDDTLIEDIDTEKILLAPDRVANNVDYILKHFDQKTMQRVGTYKSKSGHVRNGYNSIFAVSSINAAKVYYSEFKRQMTDNPDLSRKVALIYSYGVNNEDSQFLQEEDSDSAEALSVPDRDFLEDAVSDYNEMFGTQYDTSGTLFANYYKDLSRRMKDGEIDILIVVNMFLTGFDAPCLNTLWVDKNLRQHGLVQAFSRTNRILNSVKTYGNIVCFRNLRQEVDNALALFGDETSTGLVLLKTYEDYYYGYDEKMDDGSEKHHNGYEENIERLLKEYPLDEEIISESKQKEFIKLFNNILRLNNILSSFDKFAGNEILTPAQMQDYLSIYQDIHDGITVVRAKTDVSADIVFEMELVKQIVVNIDYILELISAHFSETHQSKIIPVDVSKAINSNPELRPKRELIERFIETIDDTSHIGDDWSAFIENEKEKELSKIIKRESLREEETTKYIQELFTLNEFLLPENVLESIIPPMSRFAKDGMTERQKKKSSVRTILEGFFEKYKE